MAPKPSDRGPRPPKPDPASNESGRGYSSAPKGSSSTRLADLDQRYGDTGDTGAYAPGWRAADASWADYLQFRRENQDWLNEWSMANPGQHDFIWSTVWTATITGWSSDKLYDEFQKRGIVAPKSLDQGGGGGRGGGGGGGGGISKEQQYANAAAAIRDEADAMGLIVDDAGVAGIAQQAVDGSWSGDVVTDVLVGLIANDWSNVRGGQLSGYVNQVRQLAAAQLLAISDATAREYARRIQSRQLTVDGVTSIMREQAKLNYSWAAPTIDQGIGMRDFLAPTRDMIASELELGGDQVDMMDPRWLGMMQTRDEKSGATRVATLNEITQRVRQTGEWSKTTRARQLTASVGQMVRDVFEGRG